MRFNTIPPDTMLAIIGLPRSGSTIVASFVNSIHKSFICGEIHRSRSKRDKVIMKSRYGPFIYYPGVDVLDQINSFAGEHGLSLRGFKEVLDINLGINPIDLVQSYGARIDKTLVTIREPNKSWSSIHQIGHHKSLPMDVFVKEYIRLVNFALDDQDAIPIVLENFLAAPVAYMSGKFGIDIDGFLSFEKYTGGGDPHTIKDEFLFRTHDDRIPYTGPGLRKCSEAYDALLNIEYVFTEDNYV